MKVDAEDRQTEGVKTQLSSHHMADRKSALIADVSKELPT
jgi:hypothetical protein